MYHKVVLEHNSAGRICNYHWPNDGEATAQVPEDEFERFNQLAGRQHRIEDGVVVYDETLEVAYPDGVLPPLEAALQAKLNELDRACSEVIWAGIDVETSLGVFHFNLSDRDQTNLLGIGLALGQLAMGMPSDIDPAQGVWYKADNPDENHRYWPLEDIQLVFSLGFKFKTETLTYLDYLKTYTRTLEDISDINSVFFGLEIQGAGE